MPIKTDSLTPKQQHIIIEKGTEPPFSSTLPHTASKQGTFLCRNCGLALFRESSSFSSGCGWPSFDESLQNSVLQLQDIDGRRTEIVCARCQGHLGHVFLNEGFTAKNTRHCVNALSIEFVEDSTVCDTNEIIVAGGCFWGIEHLFQQKRGVLLAESGYIGGHTPHPSYEAVCKKKTGHYEAVRVVFDTEKQDLASLYAFFFEIHDFTQKNGQGPDIGPQYQSALFVYDEEQIAIAQELFTKLENKGFSIATKILPVTTFWPAEDYHQDYYLKNGKVPYCHNYKPIF